MAASADPTVLAARAEFLALRASLPADAHVHRDRIRIAPSADELTENEAAARLAALPKPIQCTPSLDAGALVVKAQQLAAERARVQGIVAKTFTEAMSELASTPDASVLLKGRHESLLLSDSAYQLWVRDYAMPEHCAYGGLRPSDEERAAGIVKVLQISRTEPLIDSYRLVDGTDVMCERCGLRFATAVVRNRKLEPALKSLLCEDCLDAENGRTLYSTFRDAGATPLPELITDAQFRQFFRDFPGSLDGEGHARSSNGAA